MVFNNNLLLGAAGQGGAGYQIDQSIRFDKTTSSHLSKTYGSAGNRRTWTFSTWFKRGKIDGTRQILFAATGQAYLQVGPDAASREMITILNEGSGTDLNWYTTQVFRDPSAWYHLVWQFDSTQATADDRTKLYINGSQVTDFTKAATPAQNFEGAISNAVEHKIGEGHTAANYFDGLQSEIHFIDGTALDPTSFGETNDDGVWIPKAYSGAYGTNGFYITGATASDLGEDFSGNNNDFTSSGLATTDQMLDTPTLNWCTINPNDKFGSGLTLSDGNLRAVPSASAYCNNHGTFYVNSGKWVFEVKHTTVFGEACGWSPMGERIAGSSNRGYFMFADGRAYINTSNQGTKGASLASGDYRYIFYDADLQAMWFAHVDVSSSNALVYDNSATKAEIEAGTTTNAVFTSIQDVDFAPGLWMDTSGVIEVNFGQSAFITSSDLPTGFNTLNTANLATPSITDGSAHFNPVLFTANSGTAFSVTGVGFQPDWVWGKSRSYVDNHRLIDVVRGSTKNILSNAASAESTQTQGITSFDSDGFTVGTHPSLNNGTNTYVAWCWLADNTTGSSNTDGSVTSTVSNNSTSNFSIVKYTGTGSGNSTVGHGLGVTPDMIIVKHLDRAQNWRVFHTKVGVGSTLFLNSTAAAAADPDRITAVSSTTFTAAANMNESADYIAYCFAEVDGYSSFGSYTGNGSTDGPFVYTGFSPKYILYKRTSGGTGNWDILDTERDPINVADAVLAADKTTAETTYATIKIDMLSNGYKIRGTQTNLNASGSTYIYMAFAENPFGGDGVAPATAR
jgi:hypothetical protein